MLRGSLDTLGVLLMDQGEHSFGALLPEYRLTANLSQATLAEQAGISTRATQVVGRGDPQSHRDTLRLLGAALGLPADEETVLRTAALPSLRQCAPSAADLRSD